MISHERFDAIVFGSVIRLPKADLNVLGVNETHVDLIPPLAEYRIRDRLKFLIA